MKRLLAVLLLLLPALAFGQPATWTTGSRPSTPADGTVGYNATLGYQETYSAALGAWSPVLRGNVVLGGTVSGAGITSLFAAPPAIGSTTASTGAFTTLSTSGTINGVNIIGGTLSGYNGNTFLGAEQNSANFTGTESNFVGDRAGGNVTTGSFNWVGGHDAFGIGGGCSGIYMNSGTVTGVDNLRNSCGGGGGGGFDTYGAGVLKTYNQVGTSSNNYLVGISAFGANSLFYWNGAVSYPYDTVFGNTSCVGAATGTVNFTGVTCLGPRGGPQLTTATNSILINGGTNPAYAPGATTFASGSGVILISSGQYAVDTPTAGTTDFINIDNTIIAVSHLGVAWVSGFGSNAGGASGLGSNYELFNVGTGGTASSGVFALPSAAPNGWVCTGRDKTNPSAYTEDFTPVSTTNVSVTNYSRTTGAAIAWTSGDQLQISCAGY